MKLKHHHNPTQYNRKARNRVHKNMAKTVTKFRGAFLAFMETDEGKAMEAAAIAKHEAQKNQPKTSFMNTETAQA